MASRTFRLDKIVRDGIVQSHIDEGGSCETRELSKHELAIATDAKITEELEELRASKSRSVGEYGDVVETLLHDAELAGHSREKVFEAMAAKTERIGSFSTNTYVETVTVPEKSWLAEYYGSNPERFPEIDE